MREGGNEQIDAAVDAFVGRQARAGHVFEPISEAPWIVSFEAKLPFRLPPSFRSLVSRYRFGPFDVFGIRFFGNSGAGDLQDLVVASLRGPVLVRVCQRGGFLHVGRPSTGAYDPVCFDMTRRTNEGEAPLVCLEHEEILIGERIGGAKDYGASFAEMIGRSGL